ncbi:hypothetical protein IW140_004296 [Coemansia sp. RSA 1813]|nr:hypothetical protein LPJ74_004178 [Coemansia sp. RSA 1843]KAJ2088128.1 hypothetical protein IW138_004467 [Coemansia sp. RSA 986]KAJ2214849.1 hypothetical protein EV179_002659 [Coemansia sp. RSA 487]KAJ2567861.1 hypothetical protein IW140_004296 [Coemansia sp. RSA 1813]
MPRQTIDVPPVAEVGAAMTDDTMASNSSSSSKDSGDVSSEFFGDNYIKETDDSKINRTMGVGACSLHPCLTRRARESAESNNVARELSAERKANRISRAQEKESMRAMLAMEGARSAVGLPKHLDTVDSGKQDDEEKLADLLKHHVHMHDGRDTQGLPSASSMPDSGIPLSGNNANHVDYTTKSRGDNARSSGTTVQHPEEQQRTQETTASTRKGHHPASFAHSYSTSQLRQSNVQLLQQQQQQQHQQQHPSRHPHPSNSSTSSLSPSKTATHGSTQSDNGLPGAYSSSQLLQKRKELEMAGMRHSEAAAHAVRTMERGLAESMRSGADTPTVDLVQTAVSVREVSKLIGRTVVQVSNVRRIMVVTKPNDTSLVSLTRDLATWLIDGPKDEGSQPIVVYVEERITKHRNFNLQRVYQKCPVAQTNLEYWTPELCAKSPEIFDFVVTLGGDGTVLYTSWLFQKTVPPIIPFHLGSLGFLTVFDHKHARRVLGSVINNGVRINLRMRFTCTVYRLADAVAPEHANVLVDAADCNKVINHAMATHGIQGAEEHLCSDKEKSGDVPGSANLAAINNMSAAAGKKLARSFSSSTRRPPSMPRSSSGATATTTTTATATKPSVSSRSQQHSRRQSSSNHSRTSRRSSNGHCSSDCCHNNDGSCSCSGDETGSAREDDGGTRNTSRSSKNSNGGTQSRALRKRHTHSGSQHRRHNSQHQQQSQGGIYSTQANDTASNSIARSRSRQRRSSGESRKSTSGGHHRGSSESQDRVENTTADRGEKQEHEQEREWEERSELPLPSAPNTSSRNEDSADNNDVGGVGGPLTRHSTINESEWEDVPKPYQRRMRKVWKRDSTFQVMNEVVVDRGPSPYLSQLELYGDGNHLTTVEADGLCLATPTGSTAYSLAAGGSLVHPEIPAIMVTPICPHTLSFRPMLLPDTMVLRVVLPPDSRNTAWASFDGRHRTELRRGDHIQITASKYPLPTVCASQSQTQDWMSSLSRCLHWNERKRQKKFGGGVSHEPDSGAAAGAHDGAGDGYYSYKRGISTDDNESPSDDSDAHEVSSDDASSN